MNDKTREIQDTLNMIYNGNTKVIGDTVILYRQDDKFGYYDIVNDVHSDAFGVDIEASTSWVLVDTDTHKKNNRYNRNVDHASGVIHFVESNKDVTIDTNFKLLKSDKCPELVIIKQIENYKIYSSITGELIWEGNLKRVDFMGRDIDIPLVITLPNRKTLGILKDGTVGEVKSLLEKMYIKSQIKEIRNGSTIVYDVTISDKIYHLNRNGQSYI